VAIPLTTMVDATAQQCWDLLKRLYIFLRLSILYLVDLLRKAYVEIVKMCKTQEDEISVLDAVWLVTMSLEPQIYN